MTQPGHDPKQVAAALAVANETRRRRGEAHARLMDLPGPDARLALADLIEEMPPWLGGEPTGRLLRWPHGMGRALMLRALWWTGAPARSHVADLEMKPVGKLTDRQRAALAAWLRGEHL